MSYTERNLLPRRVEVSSVRDWRSSDITARWHRGTVVPFLDDPQSGGGCDHCVVRFYGPRFVLLHANRSIVTKLVPHETGN